MLFTSYRSVGYYLGLGAIFLIVSFVFAYDNSDAIKIARGTISGPTLSGFKQTAFELAAIDKQRTKQQTIWNKLNGRTIIYAQNGQKIQINHTSFDKTKRATILKILNLNDYP